MRRTALVAFALGGMFFIHQDALACSRVSPVSVSDMIRGADAIVRVLASEYKTPPADPTKTTTGVPESRIRFGVLEVIRGQGIEKDLILTGYLSNRDDFNDQAPPYSFVRPNGRSGSCFANTHRAGAQFLLMLKKVNDGDYTVNWYALGPVNEQLRSENDPWLLWVRREAHRGVLPNKQTEPTRH
jgi:hypothetical protein